MQTTKKEKQYFEKRKIMQTKAKDETIRLSIKQRMHEKKVNKEIEK